MTSLISFENKTKPKNILGTTCRTFGNRCLRYWLLHLKNENARDATVTLKTYTIMPLVKRVALVRCWPQFLSVCLQRFQNKKHFLVYTLRKSETLKEKCTHFKQGQQASCEVIVMVMAWFVMGTDDGWREGGVRCEDDVSGQLAAAVKSPFESTVGQRWQVDTTQDSAASFSFAFKSWLYLKGDKKRHIGPFDWLWYK